MNTKGKDLMKVFSFYLFYIERKLKNFFFENMILFIYKITIGK